MVRRILGITVAFVVIGAVASCDAPDAAPPAPAPPELVYDPSNPLAWCMAAAELLNNPYLGAGQQTMLLENMRNAGCMNLAQRA